jgi:hypothetical protein
VVASSDAQQSRYKLDPSSSASLNADRFAALVPWREPRARLHLDGTVRLSVPGPPLTAPDSRLCSSSAPIETLCGAKWASERVIVTHHASKGTLSGPSLGGWY